MGFQPKVSDADWQSTHRSMLILRRIRRDAQPENFIPAVDSPNGVVTTWARKEAISMSENISCFG